MSHCSSPTDALRMRSIAFASVPAGHAIEVFLMAAGPAAAMVDIVGTDGSITVVTATRADTFTRRRVILDQPADRLVYDPDLTVLSVAYAYDPETVTATGIMVLHAGPAPTLRALQGYHFRPPFGWMNDPNGFGRFDGLVHLFYQHHPHRLRWHAMHWGHAVSDDFLRWRHLPIFLEPSDAVIAAKGAGGVFSGSAIAVADEAGFRAFFTDHIDGRKPEMEIQCAVRSIDGVTAQAPEVVLNGRPGGLDLSEDNRDPYVFTGPDGRLKMLLGSRDSQGGVVLLYETEDASGTSGWTFVGPIHRERDFGHTAGECPSLLPLDGDADDPATHWLLIVGLLHSRDPQTRRRNLTMGLVGRFDGRTFVPDFRQELDFATDAYGFQAFADDGGAVAIAWLANWTDVVKTRDWPTAMTLPRRFLLKDGALLTPPIEAAITLRQELIDDQQLAAGAWLPIPDGAAEIVLDLTAAGAAFDLVFAHPTLSLGVRADADGLAILHAATSSSAGPSVAHEAPRYLARGARVRSLRVFVDKGSIEVFADDGRYAGTKRLGDAAAITAVRLDAPTTSVAAVRVYRLGL